MGNTLSFEGFKNVMISQLNKRLEADSGGMKVELDRAVRNNDTVREGIRPCASKDTLVPVIYLDDLYSLYEDGTGIEELIDEVKLFFESSIAQNMTAAGEMGKFMHDWERVRPFVECRLVNSNANSRRLAGTPYRRMGEFAISYQIKISSGGQGYYATQIKDCMLESWGVSEEELHEAALSNMNLPLNFVLRKAEDVTGMPGRSPMFILTTKKQIHGATAIISDEVRQNVGKYMGGDYYILPSSIHELIILPKKSAADVCALERIVRRANRSSCVSEDEFLSDNVYEYDMTAAKLLMARNHIALS